MSIQLFFNTITAFVSAQFIVISEFLDACKMKSSDCSFNHFGHVYLDSSATEVLHPNLETDGNHLVPGQENMVDAFLQSCFQI